MAGHARLLRINPLPTAYLATDSVSFIVTEVTAHSQSTSNYNYYNIIIIIILVLHFGVWVVEKKYYIAGFTGYWYILVRTARTSHCRWCVAKDKDASLRSCPSGIAQPQSRTDLQQTRSRWSRLLRAAKKLLAFVRQEGQF